MPPFERNSDSVKELQYQYLHRIMALKGNKTPHILVFVDEAGLNLAKGRRHGHNRASPTKVCNCVRLMNFQSGPPLRAWFTTHPKMVMVFLPPYSPFLNPIEELFSAWMWRVYKHQTKNQRSLLHTMGAACDDFTGDQCRGWLRHACLFFPHCITRENIHCDVDKNLWPDRQQHVDGQGGEDGGQKREGEDSDQ